MYSDSIDKTICMIAFDLIFKFHLKIIRVKNVIKNV